MGDRVAFTGTRPPPGGFSAFELAVIVDQVRDLPYGTRIAQGGCTGVDAIIGRTAHARGLYVVTYLPAVRWRTETALDVHEWSDEVIDTGRDLLSRNHDIVDFGQRVRGIPLYEGHVDPQRRNRVYCRRQPRSGTWAALRLAQDAGTLERIVTLRPAGLPGPIVEELRNGRLVVVRHLQSRRSAI